MSMPVWSVPIASSDQTRANIRNKKHGVPVLNIENQKKSYIYKILIFVKLGMKKDSQYMNKNSDVDLLPN
jgi:hypothetical protein